MTQPVAPPHPCPGGCGLSVQYWMFACRACWKRLPGPYRYEISHAYRRRRGPEHRAAMLRATEWYKSNPIPAPGG